MRGKKARKAAAILIVTPALVGGSWILINELARRLRDSAKIVISALGPRSQTISEARCYCLPWLDYEEYGARIDRNMLAVLWFEGPLLILSLLLWARYRPKIWLGNGLLSSALGIVPQKILNASVVVSYNAYMSAESEMRKSLARVVARHATLIFVNSPGSLLDAESFADREKIRILPHSADDLFFEDGQPEVLGRQLGLTETFVVLFVGRLDREKHCDFLLRVAEASNPDRISFVFVGHGPLAEEIQAVSERTRNVRFLGRITDRVKLRDAYQMADVVWSYADETYLAKPAVEALASGTPIMVPDVPAILVKTTTKARIDPSLVPPDVGWLVSIRRTHDIARLIEEIDRSGLVNAPSRRRCREYASQHYSSRNADKAVEQLLSFVGVRR